jgi:hypothetical protein
LEKLISGKRREGIKEENTSSEQSIAFSIFRRIFRISEYMTSMYAEGYMGKMNSNSRLTPYTQIKLQVVCSSKILKVKLLSF